MTNGNDNMPNLNNLERLLREKTPSPAKKASPQRASSRKASSRKASSRKASPGLTNLLSGTPGKDFNYINDALASGVNLKDILGETPSRAADDFNWSFLEPTKARKMAPKARKTAPKAKARKMAPTTSRPASTSGAQSRLSTPNRQFGGKFEGMNTGEKDDKGRIIYTGKRGGKFVISASGARVPYTQNKLSSKLEKGKYPFTGKVDRNGLKVYKGPRGGLFVVDNKSGKKKNPLQPLKDA
ncbi:PBCV-specific basic adaptor domain-containing protein [Acanthocystis turfacea Chlorella virus MN0810.1]|nr:PBCV-specific basic adaptor domain-containing protein [Acanthocystis turfacea Chlorella virus MN0810.1]